MYCTLDDLKRQIPETTIRTLTDDEGTGEINMPRVEQAIADAEAEINAYAQKQYPVPFNPVPEIIRKLAVDIAIYNLFSRRGFSEESGDKIVQDRYKAAVKLLENLARGVVQLGAAAPPPPEGPRFDGPGRIFTRDSLKGM